MYDESYCEDEAPSPTKGYVKTQEGWDDGEEWFEEFVIILDGEFRKLTEISENSIIKITKSFIAKSPNLMDGTWSLEERSSESYKLWVVAPVQK